MQQDVGTQKEDQLISRSAQGCHTGYVRLFFSMSAQQSDLDAVKARDPSALRSPRIMPAIGGKRKQPETATDIDLVALHRARIVDWSPTAVTALAASADGTVVAAARESGSIEIWSTAHWQCIKQIPGTEYASISCLTWTHEAKSGQWRVFSGGLDGLLVEWDLKALRPRSVSDSFGGAVWSLAVDPNQSSDGSPQRVAVACDDGALRVFEAQEGVAGLQYAKTLPRTEGRVLSAAWHPDSSTIVTGTSSGILHVWELASNRELLRITAGNGASVGSEVCIWSVMVLSDGTMVSGDSAGALQLWDSRHGTLLQAFTQHKADILAVAASKDGSTLFATGIDVQVACFRRIPGQDGSLEKWVYLDTRRPHTHDVRAMLVLNPADADSLLLTGANDAQLFAYSVQHFQTSHPVRVCKVPQRPGLHLAAPAASPSEPVSLLAVQPLHVDLWQTGCTAGQKSRQSNKAGRPVASDLTALPTHIARIKKVNDDHIICGAISSDGSAVAFSDGQGLHLYQFSAQSSRADEQEHAGSVEADADEPNLMVSTAKAQQVAMGRAGRKLARLSAPQDLPSFHELQYRPESSQVIGLTPKGSLLVVDSQTAAVVQELNGASQLLQVSSTVVGASQTQQVAIDQLTSVSNLIVSPTGKWAAVTRACHVHVFDLDSMSYHGRLPPLQDASPLTTIAFSSSGDGLIAANASNHIGVYNVESLAATDWTRTVGSNLPARLLDIPGSIASISVNPQAAEIVVATPSSACHISLTHHAPLEAVAAPKDVWGAEYPYQSVNTAQGASNAGENFRVLPMLHPVLMLAYTSPSSLLLVDKPWEGVYKGLPEPLYKHRYGS